MNRNFNEIIIGNKKVGGNNPCFIIAEIGINHNGIFDNAIKMIDAAKEAGCDAVKFQAFKAEKMYSKKAGKMKFNNLVYPIYERVKTFELPLDWVPKLKKYCDSKKIIFFSSVCDEESADTIDKFSDCFKLTSYSINHPSLQTYVAKKGKPIIFSTGGAKLEEVKEALNNIKKDNNQIAILQCTIKYPCPLEDANLGVIRMFKKIFPSCVIGYSDHTANPTKAPIAAVALGAKIIEKHITLDKKMTGPDHSFALEPQDLKKMVMCIRETERRIENGERIKIDKRLLGCSDKKAAKCERYLIDFAYSALFAVKDIKKGDVFTKENIAVLRKSNFKQGIEPKYYERILGRRAKSDINSGIPLTKKDIRKNIVAIIQARVGSHRLKNKVLMKIKDKAILEWVILRVKESKLLDNVVVATSEEKGNEKVVEIARKNKVDCFVGSENDVLGRIYEAARKFNADTIIRVTADEPLIDPKVIDLCIKNHLKEKADYTTTTQRRTFPKGVDAEVLSFNCLKKVNEIAKKDYDREHVTSFILSNKNVFRIKNVETKRLKRNYALTVDEMHDFKFVEEIFNHFGNKLFYTKEIIDFLDKRIVIRVDGSNKGGLGHVYRCLILAKELKKRGYFVSFISQDIDDIPKRIKKEGFEAITLSKDSNEKQRAKELVEILKSKRPNILITDLIEINFDFSDEVKKIGVKIICVDILGKIKFKPHVVINRTLVKERYKNYNFNSNIKYYLGPKYEILNKSFELANKTKRSIDRKVKNVLVTLGGSDPENLCPRVIKALEGLGVNVNIVMGPAYHNIKQIKDVLRAIKNKNDFKLLYDIDNMAQLMLKSDIAITAGGLTLLELAATGTPAIVCCEVPHQVENANAIQRKGTVVNLGLLPDKDKIKESFLELANKPIKRKYMSWRGKRITDGKGLERVCEIIGDFIK